MPKTAPPLTLLTILEKVMPNVKGSQVKKSIKRKKHPCIVNILKESIGATTIIKDILDLRINLIIGKLLISAPIIKK